MATKTGSSLPTLLVICALAAAAGVVFAGPIGARDEGPRWIRLSVTWSPSPRAQPIHISYAINGMPGPDVPAVTHSPWPPRDVALHTGEGLVLRAVQLGAGALSCVAHEGGRVVAHDGTDVPGVVECVVVAR